MTGPSWTITTGVGEAGIERNRELLRRLAEYNDWPPGFAPALDAMHDEFPGWSFWWRRGEWLGERGCVALWLDMTPQGKVEIVAETPEELAALVRAEEEQRQRGRRLTGDLPPSSGDETTA